MLHRDSDFNRTLWLLQIDPDRQTIEPLAIDPCSHFADFASAGDDRLVYTWEENDREFATVRAIPADGHSEDSDAEAQFQFPREVQRHLLLPRMTSLS